MIVELQPREVVALFLRRIVLFFSVVVFFGAIGAVYLILAVPKYRSEATVVVRFDDKAIPVTNLAKDSTSIVTAQNDRHETVLAHTDILTSYDLARQVIIQIGLQNLYPDIVADPPSVGTPLDEGIRVFARSLFADPEQQGDAINLSFDHPSPNLARTVLTDVINEYMRREADIFTHPQVEFQQVQLDKASKQLEDAQTDLSQFKAEMGINSFDDQMSALVKQRTDLSAALQSSDANATLVAQRRDELDRQLRSVSASLMNSASGEKYRSVDDAQTTLDGLQLKERQFAATYQANSPVFEQLRAQIAAASAYLKSRRSDISHRDSSAPNVVFQNIQTDLIRAKADALATFELQ